LRLLEWKNKTWTNKIWNRGYNYCYTDFHWYKYIRHDLSRTILDYYVQAVVLVWGKNMLITCSIDCIVYSVTVDFPPTCNAGCWKIEKCILHPPHPPPPPCNTVRVLILAVFLF
jgi:hypothetical protein